MYCVLTLRGNITSVNQKHLLKIELFNILIILLLILTILISLVMLVEYMYYTQQMNLLIGLNKTVTVYIPEDDECETYKIVTSIRGNSMKNLISIESPLGKALLRHHVGDKVMIPVSSDYSYEVEIREIKDTSDEEDDNIRAF